ncbi:hypothetical protein Ciccas_011088 [Cichlidogyrus casuarinus]|uniref:Uncharacterized protein n=1 Tax=Cichlidogyrus casuarinus TaxID=1844966 RepID=A0ABD2PTD9_9PLAT
MSSKKTNKYMRRGSDSLSSYPRQMTIISDPLPPVASYTSKVILSEDMRKKSIPFEKSVSEVRVHKLSRGNMLKKMLEGHGLPENVEPWRFDEFVNWYENGCDLTQFKTLCADTYDDEDSDSSVDSDCDVTIFTEPEQVDTRKIKLVKKFSYSSSAYSSPGHGAKPNKFILRLFEEVVQPAMQFDDAKLTNQLLMALPHKQITISPLKDTVRIMVYSSVDQDEPEGDTCPLVQGHQGKYALTIESSRKYRNGNGYRSHSISKLARDRIASVINLYVSLCQIKQNAQEIKDREGRETYSTMEKTFQTIQKHKLSIDLARLGFGLPDYVNPILKSYVETLEKECLEAQASIFEESNRKIQSVLHVESVATKRAIEKEQENEVLRAECQALKVLIQNMDSDQMENYSKSSDDSRKPNTFLRRVSNIAYPEMNHSLDRATSRSSICYSLSSPPRIRREAFFRKVSLVKSRSRLDISSSPQPPSRPDLFNMLLEGHGYPDNVPTWQFLVRAVSAANCN